MTPHTDLASAIARANAALDWIEARQGPLPADGYARIETSVGVVRALANEISDFGKLGRLIKQEAQNMARIVEFHSSEEPYLSMSEALNYGLIEPLIYRDLDDVMADIPAACCRRCGEVTLRSNKVASHLCTTPERIERMVDVGMKAFRRIAGVSDGTE